MPETHAPTDRLRPDALERFVAPSRLGRDGGWRVALTLLAALLAPAFAAAALSATAPGWDVGPLALPVLLLLLAAAALVLLLCVRALHARPATTLFAPSGRPALGALGRAAALFAGLALAQAALLAGLGVVELRPAADRTTTAALLASAAAILLAAPLQAGAEELLYRGYLLQEAARRSASPWAWAGAPAALFALLHLGAGALDAPPRALDIGAALSALMFGLCAAALVARDGHLYGAIGAHLGANLPGFLLIGSPRPFGGAALFAATPSESLPIAAVVAFGLATDAALFALGYRWLKPSAAR